MGVLAPRGFNHRLAFGDFSLQVGNPRFRRRSQGNELLAARLPERLQCRLFTGGVSDNCFRSAADGLSKRRKCSIDDLLPGVFGNPARHVLKHIQSLLRRERHRPHLRLAVQRLEVHQPVRIYGA